MTETTLLAMIISGVSPDTRIYSADQMIGDSISDIAVLLRPEGVEVSFTIIIILPEFQID
jgi:hypothetical protein